MSENAIDSENTNKPAPDEAKPKGARKACKKTKPAKNGVPSKKAARQAESRPHQQEGRSNRHDEAREGRLVLGASRFSAWYVNRAAAHLWQLLMAGQLPLVLYFAVKWLPHAPCPALRVLALQAVAIVAACAPVYVLGL
jgi:hypothetical protein